MSGGKRHICDAHQFSDVSGVRARGRLRTHFEHQLLPAQVNREQTEQAHFSSCLVIHTAVFQCAHCRASAGSHVGPRTQHALRGDWLNPVVRGKHYVVRPANDSKVC